MIMACTPDSSHTEQLSMVLRIVSCEESVGATITEHFVGFIEVDDTTEKGLFETFCEQLKKWTLTSTTAVARCMTMEVT